MQLYDKSGFYRLPPVNGQQEVIYQAEKKSLLILVLWFGANPTSERARFFQYNVSYFIYRFFYNIIQLKLQLNGTLSQTYMIKYSDKINILSMNGKIENDPSVLIRVKSARTFRVHFNFIALNFFFVIPNPTSAKDQNQETFFFGLKEDINVFT